MIDFSDQTPHIAFRKTDEDGNVHQFNAPVLDKFPDLAEDLHVEGRRYVEVSVEMFIDLVAGQGYYPVNPATGKTTEDED